MRPFGHTRPVRDGDGAVIGAVPSPVQARTLDGLSPVYGPDRRKRLVVALEAGDVITIRPERTRRKVSILAVDLYAYLLRLQSAKYAAERKLKRKFDNPQKKY